MVDSVRFERSNRLKQILESLNINGKAFAKTIGISQGMVSNVMNGKRAMTIDFVDRITDRYSHLNPAWLLFGYGSMTKTTTQDRLIGRPEQDAKPQQITLEGLAKIILSIQEENNDLRRRIEEMERQQNIKPPP